MERIGNFKLKAFTLLELIVVLTVTTLVIALGYSSYQLINRYYINQLDDHQDYEEWATLMYQFQHDFIMSESATLTEGGIQLKHRKDSMLYSWEGDYTIRKMLNRVDTFHIVVTPNYFYMGKKKQVYGLVDKVEFTMQKVESFTFSKEYTAAILLNDQYNADGN